MERWRLGHFGIRGAGRHVGANNYLGNFHNSEYGVSGTISVVVSGNSQTVRLNSEAGTGRLELRR